MIHSMYIDMQKFVCCMLQKN